MKVIRMVETVIDLPEMMPDLPETAGAHMRRRAVITTLQESFKFLWILKKKKESCGS